MPPLFVELFETLNKINNLINCLLRFVFLHLEVCLSVLPLLTFLLVYLFLGRFFWEFGEVGGVVQAPEPGSA